MSPAEAPQAGRTGRARILAATGLAILAAALALFGVVLPAEHRFDPLGTGKALGLLALSQERPIAAQEREYRTDTSELVLLPDEWVEYKYGLEQGASMLFSWQATATVSYDFHSQPEGAAGRFAESFEARDADHAYGSYTAPFLGIHGWYWQNKTADTVTLRLDTAGFYTSAVEFRDRVSGQHTLTDLRGEKIANP